VNRRGIQLIAILVLGGLVWMSGANSLAAELVSAPAITPAPVPCLACHEAIRAHWLESAHATAVTNADFQSEWHAQGLPGACLECHAAGSGAVGGVSCTACHAPAPNTHPDAIMPTSVSSRMCAGCHVDTYADWQDAYHSRADLRCVHCHDPHAAGLKLAAMQTLCRTCHETANHTAVADFDENTPCADCHMRLTTHQAEDGRRWQDHTLVLHKNVCLDCPADEIVDSEGGLTARAADDGAYPVTPVSFALVAALLGLGAMVVLAPWLSRWLGTGFS